MAGQRNSSVEVGCRDGGEFERDTDLASLSDNLPSPYTHHLECKNGAAFLNNWLRAHLDRKEKLSSSPSHCKKKRNNAMLSRILLHASSNGSGVTTMPDKGKPEPYKPTTTPNPQKRDRYYETRQPIVADSSSPTRTHFSLSRKVYQWPQRQELIYAERSSNHTANHNNILSTFPPSSTLRKLMKHVWIYSIQFVHLVCSNLIQYSVYMPRNIDC
jgi:hypothetical protein